MVLDVIGALIVLTHLIVVAMFIIWFGLRKPTTMEQFRTRFKAEFFGIGRDSR